MAKVIFIILCITSSLWLPKNYFQLNKEKLEKNPKNLNLYLITGDWLLQNYQYQEAEKMLIAAESAGASSDLLASFWSRKHAQDPIDIKKQIAVLEKVSAEKPDYRDVYLKLAILNYQIFNNPKAKEYLMKAEELDPNYPLTRKLFGLIG